MAQVAETSDFIAAAFRTWRQAGVKAVVLRNHQELPANPGNDIDVLFWPTHAAHVDKILLETAQQCGWRLHNRAEYATLALYFHSPSGEQVHFDLFTDFTWRGLPYADDQAVFEQRERGDLFDVASPLHQSGINLLSGLFYSGKVKEKYRSPILASAEKEQESFTKFLSSCLGWAMAERVIQQVKAQDWPSVEASTASLRRTLMRRQLIRAPVQTFIRMTRDFDRIVRRFLNPPGLAMVLCGPDGCGKSTVSPLLIAALERSFPQNKGARFHWKPAIFSRHRQEARGPSANPHSNPPRNRFFSVVFFAAHWLEFLIGWHVRIRPLLFRGGLVLIDRWYYDFFVDQRRYRLNIPMLLVRLGHTLLPKPHLVCLLDAPTSVLRQRKQEVSPEETERQRAAYLDVIQAFPNAHVISAAQAPKKVAKALAQAAFTASSKRLRI